ncbi:MAG: hypothetical protein QOJ26_349 [Thermoplasmata archaeon]|nr:hypothetical protein [Thermoplasmata archaeon]
MGAVLFATTLMVSRRRWGGMDGRTAGIIVALTALSLLTPTGAARNLPPEELFHLILVDDDGLVGYGGCTEGACAPEQPRAYDAVALDAREVADPSGVPQLVFRFLVAPVDDDLARTIALSGMAGGREFTLQAIVEGNRTTASAGVGQEPYASGEETAVEVVVPYSGLGVQVGTQLADLRVETMLDDARGDIMPGGWYDGDTLVPHIPHEVGELTEVTEEPAPGQYSLLGPAPLITIDAPLLGMAEQGWAVTLNVTSQLGTGDQEVTATAAGISISTTLPAGATRMLRLQVGADAGATVLRIHSDLGGYQERPLDVPAPAVQESPLPPTLALAAVALALGLAARRRR